MRRAKKKKGCKGQRMEPPTPTRAMNAFIGNEEQNGKQKEKQGMGPTLDHMLGSYSPHGSYSEPILKPPPHSGSSTYDGYPFLRCVGTHLNTICTFRSTEVTPYVY